MRVQSGAKEEPSLRASPTLVAVKLTFLLPAVVYELKYFCHPFSGTGLSIDPAIALNE